MSDSNPNEVVPPTLRLVFVSDESNKFWEVTSSGNDVTVCFGRIGTAGQTQTKSFESAALALSHRQKLVAEKRKKGYVDDAAKAVDAAPVQTRPLQTTPIVAASKEEDSVPVTNNPSTTQKVDSASRPGDSAPPSLDAIIAAHHGNKAQAIVEMFRGLSEKQRTSLRAKFLEKEFLYATPLTFIPKSVEDRPKRSKATKLLDIAMGNKVELVYSIRRALDDFKEETIAILKDRDASWIASSIERDLLSNRSESFSHWLTLVVEGFIQPEWSDRVVQLVGESGLAMAGKGLLRNHLSNCPQLADVMYRMCEVENWGITDGTPIFLDNIGYLEEKGRLDRLRLLRSAVHGMHLVSNQNHTRGCMRVISFLDPSIDELEECQADLCAVLDQGKSLSYEPTMEYLQKLANAERLDWSVVSISLGGFFPRAGLAQSKMAIGLLRLGASSSSGRTSALTALTNSLVHSKREIAELGWKTLSKELGSTDHNAIEQIRSLLPHLSTTLRQTIESSPLIVGNSDPSGAMESAVMQSGVGGIANSETDWSHFEGQFAKLPSEVVASLQTAVAMEIAKAGAYIPSVSWDLFMAPQLSTLDKLQPVGSLDELIERVGPAVTTDANSDERELLIDAFCRYPLASDPNFKLKTAAIRKLIKSDSASGISQAFANPDFAAILYAWLDEDFKIDDRYIRNRFEEQHGFRNISILDWLKQGKSFQLLSTSTHSGGWIASETFLERLEAAENNQEMLLLADIELALIRLAPDGRTTLRKSQDLLARAKKLQGPYAPMIRFAMGEDIAWEDMTGSKRLWVAALQSRNPKMVIPDSCPLKKFELKTAVTQPAKLAFEYVPSQIDNFRGFKVRFDGGDIQRWSDFKPENIDLSPFVLAAPDNLFLSRFFYAQILGRGDIKYWYPNYYPGNLDWYWQALTSYYLYFAAKKTEFDEFVDLAPLLQSERALTADSARLLWIAALGKSEKPRLWVIETWARLIDEDRFDTSLMLSIVSEFADQEWVIPKRWGEVLTQLASRSPLHAWDAATLSMGLLEKHPFSPRDASSFLEIILEAYTWLGLAVDASQRETLSKYAAGKNKKIVEQICKLERDENGESYLARKQAIETRLNTRLERAKRFAG